LLGLADDPDADPVFKNDALDMDVLYRSGETHQVEPLVLIIKENILIFFLLLLISY
jgi:hypothetical protein